MSDDDDDGKEDIYGRGKMLDVHPLTLFGRERLWQLTVTNQPMIMIIITIIIIIFIIITRPWPAFGRQGLVGLSGGYTYHGYTSHASPRACGARLGQKVSGNGRKVIFPIYRQF